MPAGPLLPGDGCCARRPSMSCEIVAARIRGGAARWGATGDGADASFRRHRRRRRCCRALVLQRGRVVGASSARAGAADVESDQRRASPRSRALPNRATAASAPAELRSPASARARQPSRAMSGLSPRIALPQRSATRLVQRAEKAVGHFGFKMLLSRRGPSGPVADPAPRAATCRPMQPRLHGRRPRVTGGRRLGSVTSSLKRSQYVSCQILRRLRR